MEVPGWADDEWSVRELARSEGTLGLGIRAGREDEQQLLLAEWMGCQLTPRERKVGGPELAGAFSYERADSVGALGLEHADLHAGVAVSEAPDQGRHRVDRERGECGDLECPLSELDDAADHVAGLVDCPDDLARRTDERLARGGQAQPPADAVKQLDAELSLEHA